MKSCLIGFTGYVGSTLLRQTTFTDLYNSKNIQGIEGKEYDLIVCAGAPAVKWKANQMPDDDLNNIIKLQNHLKSVKAKKFILISTVDVYQSPVHVNENTLINSEDTEPYGRHRYYLEQFVRGNFEDILIIRLPGLFGIGLKKNFIYDLIHDNCLDMTDCNSVFQFYNMNYLWRDIQIAINNNLELVNFAVEPVSVKEISEYCMGNQFENITEKGPVYYDMETEYAHLFDSMIGSKYLYDKQQVLDDIKKYIQEEYKILK